jgi:hypothetical protein
VERLCKLKECEPQWFTDIPNTKKKCWFQRKDKEEGMQKNPDCICLILNLRVSEQNLTDRPSGLLVSLIKNLEQFVH